MTITDLFFSPHTDNMSGQLGLAGANPHEREPDPRKRCDAPHPAWPATTCNLADGHDGELHAYVSPADGKFIEWGRGWDPATAPIPY